jgi:hypothetical protein
MQNTQKLDETQKQRPRSMTPEEQQRMREVAKARKLRIARARYVIAKCEQRLDPQQRRADRNKAKAQKRKLARA